ncbi:MAG: pilus assembly protein CpaD, partial [Mesorhizobium sp.]
MFQSSKIIGTAAPVQSGRERIRRSAAPVLAVMLAASLAGCAGWKRDSVTVGAIPDDYRTSHPIVI